MTTAAKHLASMGVTMQQALDFIMQNLATPNLIYDIAKLAKINSSMLAEIVTPAVPGATRELVETFFNNAGLDGNSLRNTNSPEYSITDHVFLTDLQSGSVSLYNPLTGINKPLYSFNRQITDIATDEQGNIYVSEFSKIHKFNIQDGSLATLTNYNGSHNSLAVRGDIVYSASSSNNLLLAFQKDSGALIASQSLSGGVSAGDIAFVGDDLYRASAFNGLLKHNLDNEAVTVVSKQINGDYWGLVSTPSGDLRAFSWQGQVKEVDTTTGEVTQLANVPLVGQMQVSGAAEALQIHLDLFL